MLEEFDEEIFNALVEKIKILTPRHFAFELKSGMRENREIYTQTVDRGNNEWNYEIFERE